jgi:hypothetical protein
VGVSQEEIYQMTVVNPTIALGVEENSIVFQ